MTKYDFRYYEYSGRISSLRVHSEDKECTGMLRSKADQLEGEEALFVSLAERDKYTPKFMFDNNPLLKLHWEKDVPVNVKNAEFVVVKDDKRRDGRRLMINPDQNGWFKHPYLSGEGPDSKPRTRIAGLISTTEDGLVVSINRNSGHYVQADLEASKEEILSANIPKSQKEKEIARLRQVAPKLDERMNHMFSPFLNVDDIERPLTPPLDLDPV